MLKKIDILAETRSQILAQEEDNGQLTLDSHELSPLATDPEFELNKRIPRLVSPSVISSHQSVTDSCDDSAEVISDLKEPVSATPEPDIAININHNGKKDKKLSN